MSAAQDPEAIVAAIREYCHAAEADAPGAAIAADEGAQAGCSREVLAAVASVCGRPELDIIALRAVVKALLPVVAGSDRGLSAVEATLADRIVSSVEGADGEELRSLVLTYCDLLEVGGASDERSPVRPATEAAQRRSVRYFTRPEDLPLIRNTELEGASEKDEGVFKWLISPESGSDDLEVGIGWLKPGEVHILHHHLDESEFYYVLEGSSTITVDGQAERVQPGASVYIPAGVTHSIVNDSEAMCALLFGYNMHCRTTVFDE